MTITELDSRLAQWMQTWGLACLRYGMGLVFIWFGAPKLVPGLSPAEGLVIAAAPFDPSWFLPVLGACEVLIGLCLIIRRWTRLGLLLMAGHMLAAASPLITLPELAWKSFPVATLEGQYILKNVVLIGAAIVIGGACAPRRARKLSLPSSHRRPEGRVWRSVALDQRSSSPKVARSPARS